MDNVLHPPGLSSSLYQLVGPLLAAFHQPQREKVPVNHRIRFNPRSDGDAREGNAEPESKRCQRDGAEERRQQHWFYNHAAHEAVNLLVFQDSRRRANMTLSACAITVGSD